MSERDTRPIDPREGVEPHETSEFPAPVWRRNEPRIAGATHVGVVRSVNQDALGRFDDPERGEIVVVVADGLGGHRGGEVASRLAVDTIGRNALCSGDSAVSAVSAVSDEDAQKRLRTAIESANARVYDESQRDSALDGMGTTAVCLLLSEDGSSWVAHVGDSRAYRIRGERIESVTEDHSLVATLVREGVLTEEDAREDPRRNQILRALGVSDAVEVEVAEVELLPGDVFVLCSDGLHGMIDDEAIRTIANRPTGPDAIAARLIEAANEAGGTDNVTAVVVQVPDPMTEKTLKHRATRLFESTRSIFTRRDEE